MSLLQFPTRKPERSAAVGFAGFALDHRADRREDPDFIAGELADSRVRFLLLLDGAPLLKADPDGGDPLFSSSQTEEFGPAVESVYLGSGERGPVFALALGTGAKTTVERQPDILVGDLRTLAVEGKIPPDVLGALGMGKSVLAWHGRHRFCSVCGQPSAVAAAGWRRECAGCGAQHFPRVDPVAIMLVVRGEHCLLGRQPRFVAGSYSCLAGFIEPGETVESAVRREILEEAGIRVGRVQYVASQPWPFPSSLMLGFHCEAASETITIDRTELEDARWFSREEVQLMLAREHPNGLITPPAMAIAHHLIRAFAEEGSLVPE